MYKEFIQASSAKYDLRVYTPYTSNNMFDGVVFDGAPLALAFERPAAFLASVAYPPGAGARLH